MVSDFASEYGVRLHRETDLSWAEFLPLLVGLMSCDSRVWRHFTARSKPNETTEGET